MRHLTSHFGSIFDVSVDMETNIERQQKTTENDRKHLVVWRLMTRTHVVQSRDRVPTPRGARDLESLVVDQVDDHSSCGVSASNRRQELSVSSCMLIKDAGRKVDHGSA